MNYAQCNTGCITGNLTIIVGQTTTFSSPIAQCTSCYDWDINANDLSSDNQTVGTIRIVGTDMGQTVQIQGVSLGSFSLKLTYFDETGCHVCCFNGTVVSGTPLTPLPKATCFGFDPAPNGPDITDEGLLNYAYIGNPYAPPISSVGLTFTWYFRLVNGTLLTFNEQNPTFRQRCPYDPNDQYNGVYPNSSPVVSFGVIISNGVQTKILKSIQSGYPLPAEVSNGPNSKTCFIHEDCFLGNGVPNPSSQQVNKIIISPNPTTSIIKFDGDNLSSYKISIFNSNGTEIIKNSKIDQNISLEKQEKGVYVLILTDENGYRQEGKIIKE